jgi:hypothetical protein
MSPFCDELLKIAASANKELDQIRVQLAGCAVAAQGGISRDSLAHKGSYGWSPAYQDVLQLRKKYDAARKFGKTAFDWGNFREGISAEGIPLAGATLGAGIGSMYHKGLTGAALGYAAGGGLSLLRSKLKGEKPSLSRKILAGGALGYGLGGLTHAGLGRLAAARLPAQSTLRQVLTEVPGGATRRLRFAHGLTEEGLPAIGATLGTGIAMGAGKKKSRAGE